MKKTKSCRNVFVKEMILTIPSVFILESIVFIFSHKHLFLAHSDLHDVETRNSHKLYIPKHRLHAFKSNAFYNGIHFYNHLPPCFTSKVNLVPKFRAIVKSVLIKKALYTIEEFYQIPMTDWQF